MIKSGDAAMVSVDEPQPYQIPMNYAAAPEPLRRSRFGIAAFVMSLVCLFPEAGLLLATAGGAAIAHDPSGDAGGPLFLLEAAAFTLVLAVILILLWLGGFAFVLTGLIRTRGRCRWSRISLLLLVVFLIGGGAGAWLIWHWI